ncbi:hypothetical protein PybrP1_003734, partial [[Pythium] brassicae (nom. inval.)]
MAEYACELRAGDVRATRELWGRQLVVARVAPSVLARSEAHAALHAGHAVVSVDGASTAGMSARRFAGLWETPTETHVIGFRDRKRAELEAALLRDETAAAGTAALSQTAPTALEPQALENAIQQIQEKLWTHRLEDAEQEANALASAHPLLLLAKVELALVRVLVSNDAQAITRARAVAKRSLAGIQALSGLPTLSRASALSLRTALAEALLLSAALHFVADKSVQGATELRRCAAAYADLRDHVGLVGDARAAAENDALPQGLLAGLRSRLRFGLGVLQLASASAFQGVEWLGAAVGDVGRDPATALDHLIECCESAATATSPRAAWASLALFHCFRAVRTAQQTRGLGRKYALRVAHVQRQSLLRFPSSVLHLWSASLSDFAASRGDDDRRPAAPRDSALALLRRALALSPRSEHAHLLRFDAGYRFFVSHAFEAAAPLFTDVCRCASAPSKLRGLGSVFLAAGDLLVAAPAQSEPQRLRSVRLLLRAALRFLDDARAKDAEAACLHQRVSVYVDSADWYLRLLPCEILYVHCSRPSFAPVCSGSSSSDTMPPPSCPHQRALAYLSQFAVQDASVEAMGLLQSEGKVIKLNNAAERRRYRSSSSSLSLEAQAICEWSVLRASVLYHLGEFAAAQQQLATLTELLPSVGAGSFVRALVVYYSLQVRLQQRLSRPESVDVEDVNALVKRALKLESQPFEYSYLYAGKLKALTALWAKTPSAGANKAQVEVVKCEPLRLAASATVRGGHELHGHLGARAAVAREDHLP